MVAHPAWVEREFLAAALATIGAKLKEPVIDTAALTRHALGRDPERRSRSPRPSTRSAFPPTTRTRPAVTR